MCCFWPKCDRRESMFILLLCWKSPGRLLSAFWCFSAPPCSRSSSCQGKVSSGCACLHFGRTYAPPQYLQSTHQGVVARICRHTACGCAATAQHELQPLLGEG